MSLTADEKNKVVQLLGYGGKTLQPGSVIYNKILNDRLDQLTLSTENLVRTYLVQVSAIETQLFSAPSRLQAEKIGDITVNQHEMQQLRSERKKLAREIAAHVDVPYVGRNGPNVARSM
jgi:hypothetical protein